MKQYNPSKIEKKWLRKAFGNGAHRLNFKLRTKNE